MKGSCPACDAPISPDYFACRRHWFALPLDIRRGIWAGDLDSYGAALEWYQAHPDPGPGASRRSARPPVA